MNKLYTKNPHILREFVNSINDTLYEQLDLKTGRDDVEVYGVCNDELKLCIR